MTTPPYRPPITRFPSFGAGQKLLDIVRRDDTGVVVTNVGGTQSIRLGSPLLTEPPAAAGVAGGFLSVDVTSGWMADLISRCAYAGLLANDPAGSEDTSTSELAFPLYARQPSTWTQVEPGLIVLAANLTWGGLLAGTRVMAVGFYEAAAGGSLQAAVYVPAPDGALTTTSYGVSAGDLYLGIDL